MLSVNWQQARKHQTNHSPTKAAYGFGRDSRFKYGMTTLYINRYVDATPSIIYPHNLEKHQPQE